MLGHCSPSRFGQEHQDRHRFRSNVPVLGTASDDPVGLVDVPVTYAETSRQAPMPARVRGVLRPWVIRGLARRRGVRCHGWLQMVGGLHVLHPDRSALVSQVAKFVVSRNTGVNSCRQRASRHRQLSEMFPLGLRVGRSRRFGLPRPADVSTAKGLFRSRIGLVRNHCPARELADVDDGDAQSCRQVGLDAHRSSFGFDVHSVRSANVNDHDSDSSRQIRLDVHRSSLVVIGRAEGQPKPSCTCGRPRSVGWARGGLGNDSRVPTSWLHLTLEASGEARSPLRVVPACLRNAGAGDRGGLF